MTPYLEDTDFTLYVGDVREVLAGLPDGCVDCVVTSPPYWGLRDYGTGAWVGGKEDCDHQRAKPTDAEMKAQGAERGYAPHSNFSNYAEGYASSLYYGQTCGKCGATRQDQQLGLEPTPDAYVENMVAVFREVRRVLADHGTCWVNLGDSYHSAPAGNTTPSGISQSRGKRARTTLSTYNTQPKAFPGLKPKDLVGIPWRIAFALQADGWYLRADIIWAKPNPMPESVTDRPTKAHEYVFLLTKKPRYWFDAEAVRERSLTLDPRRPYTSNGAKEMDGREEWHGGARRNGDDFSGRNVRTVWEIATQPYPEAHFATYPEELVRRCLLAGCPEFVCKICGRPRERIVDTTYEKSPVHGAGSVVGRHYETGANNFDGAGMPRLNKVTETIGWSDCGHNNYQPGVVLDPFLGSGTTAVVARKHGRHTIGIELNPTYAELAAQRTRQLSLLT